ncbi:Hypothetical predicted protein [Mytilus galloprovincialis]|uniref:Uncharacterized protein n=1 Tax=Mytilus galloprovincialis TaxID=29158 RepID=A0A8B6C8D3_MYTGA|nr:Hypothetical predicted protein [Mytilus galloprovincialis]VDI01079.1 Hypothetical predicted protein [Mytilus galloprovincialis]
MSDTTSLVDDTLMNYEAKTRKNLDGTINLKDESECEGRLHGFIYLHGYDPDLKYKVPLFVQANIARTCKFSKANPTIASFLRMRTMTSMSDETKNRRSFQQLPTMEE